MLEERENYKKSYSTAKTKYEEVKNRIHEFENLNFDLLEKVKKLDYVISNNKYTQISFTKQIKDRDQEITELKQKLKAVEDFKSEKENFQKYVTCLTNNSNIIKEELEKKNQLIKSLQKQNNELKVIKKPINGKTNDIIEEKRNITWNNMPIHWKIMIKEKDKKILVLEKEINKLYSEIERFNRDSHNFKTGSMGKIKINCLPIANSNSNNNSNGDKQEGKKENFFISAHEGGN